MAIVRAQVVWESGTGLPKDDATHAFTFDVGGALESIYVPALTDALESFYDDVHSPGTASITSFMREGIVTDSPTVEWGTVNVATGVVTPTTISTFTVDNLASVGDCLPTECAVRCSVHGEITGVQATDRQRRGGPFLGPGFLATAATIASGRVLVTSGLVNAVDGAAAQLQTDVATIGYIWVVYSQAGATTHEIVGGFVDNAWDTIKRRGTDPTSRVTWSA